ncbi:MAG: Ig domain-containing protein [bacterium]
MKVKKNREINIVSLSFLDVFANTVGGLVFLLVLAMLMVGFIVFAPPQIVTEKLPDGFINQEYTVWLSAREGMGKFQWSISNGDLPSGLTLDPSTGKLAGVIQPDRALGEMRQYRFSVVCQSIAEETQPEASTDKRSYQLTVYNRTPVNTLPLRITTDEQLPTAYQGEVYPLVFAAEGGQVPYHWQVAGQFPEGLTLSSAGQVNGRATQVGKHTFEAAVTTSAGERAAKRFTLNVSKLHPPPPPTPPLKILTQKLPRALAEEDYQIWMAAEGGIPPYKWGITKNQPGWLSATDNAHSFTGKPKIGDVGNSWITFKVQDQKGNALESESLELKVFPPPGRIPPPLRIRTPSLPETRAVAPYELALAASGGYPPYHWKYTGAPIPDLTFESSDGILRGQVRSAGDYSVSAAVIDSVGAEATAKWNLHVLPPLIPLKILTTTLPQGRVDDEYKFEFSAAGGYAPYTWKLLSDSLPAGLALDPKIGQLRGKPTVAGAWPLKLTANDAAGMASENSFSTNLHILTRKGTRKLIITTQELPTLMVNNRTSITLACEGGQEPYHWQIKTPLPDGLQLQGAELKGKPRRTGKFPLDVSVTDDLQQTATAALPLVIKRVTPFWLTLLLAILLVLLIVAFLILLRKYRKCKPVEILPLRITSVEIPNARASSLYCVQLACEGGELPYHWKLSAGELPPGLQLDEDGRLHGTPFEGTYVEKTLDCSFTVEVRDNRDQRAEQEL